MPQSCSLAVTPKLPALWKLIAKLDKSPSCDTDWLHRRMFTLPCLLLDTQYTVYCVLNDATYTRALSIMHAILLLCSKAVHSPRIALVALLSSPFLSLSFSNTSCSIQCTNNILTLAFSKGHHTTSACNARHSTCSTRPCLEPARKCTREGAQWHHRHHRKWPFRLQPQQLGPGGPGEQRCFGACRVCTIESKGKDENEMLESRK
jgi:hypothetical protein